jgi:hypothetical protein
MPRRQPPASYELGVQVPELKFLARLLRLRAKRAAGIDASRHVLAMRSPRQRPEYQAILAVGYDQEKLVQKAMAVVKAEGEAQRLSSATPWS